MTHLEEAEVEHPFRGETEQQLVRSLLPPWFFTAHQGSPLPTATSGVTSLETIQYTRDDAHDQWIQEYEHGQFVLGHQWINGQTQYLTVNRDVFYLILSFLPMIPHYPKLKAVSRQWYYDFHLRVVRELHFTTTGENAGESIVPPKDKRQFVSICRSLPSIRHLTISLDRFRHEIEFAYYFMRAVPQLQTLQELVIVGRQGVSIWNEQRRTKNVPNIAFLVHFLPLSVTRLSLVEVEMKSVAPMVVFSRRARYDESVLSVVNEFTPRNIVDGVVANVQNLTFHNCFGKMSVEKVERQYQVLAQYFSKCELSFVLHDEGTVLSFPNSSNI